MKKLVSILLLVVFLITLFVTSVSGVENAKTISDGIVKWQLQNIPVDPTYTQLDPILDWASFSVARSWCAGYEDYLDYINSAVSASFDDMSLNDFARIGIAVGAARGDVKDVGGYNLIKIISEYDFTSEVHTAPLSYSLIAMNSNDYDIENKQAIENEIVDILLNSQRADGGFNFSLSMENDNSWTIDGDVDTTGMVLQGLAHYKDRADVTAAINDALAFIKLNQLASGGFGAWGESADSTSQVITALCTLEINPLGEEYTKDGNTMLSALESFVNPDGGIAGYDGKSNYMSSYQALCALNSYIRFSSGKPSLYDFRHLEDIDIIETTTKPPQVEEVEETFTQTVQLENTEPEADITKPYPNPDIPQLGDTSIKYAVVLTLMSIAVLALKKGEKK